MYESVSNAPIIVVAPPDSEARMLQFHGGFPPPSVGCAITRVSKTVRLKIEFNLFLVRINKTLN